VPYPNPVNSPPVDAPDLVGIIVSANLGGRNLTVGQKVMLYAIAYPEPKKGGPRA
jgi:hypothetical protein